MQKRDGLIFELMMDDDADVETVKDMIAWLEQQGGQHIRWDIERPRHLLPNVGYRVYFHFWDTPLGIHFKMRYF